MTFGGTLVMEKSIERAKRADVYLVPEEATDWVTLILI